MQPQVFSTVSVDLRPVLALPVRCEPPLTLRTRRIPEQRLQRSIILRAQLVQHEELVGRHDCRPTGVTVELRVRRQVGSAVSEW